MSDKVIVNISDSDREIMLSRVFDAPRELVWKAWTETEHLARWWGPRGFTITTRSRDFVPGGSWRYVMHGPDGHDYENIQTYQEIVAPERLAYKHGGDTDGADGKAVSFSVVVAFEPAGERGEKTRLTMRSRFASAAARDFVIRNYNAVEGGKQHLEGLAEHLGEMQRPASGDAPFVITRAFPAPIETMWKVWTERDHLVKWFGPKGVTMTRASLDLRPGGVFHYCLRLPAGDDMWARWVFREIVKPTRLEFVVSFSDEAGNVARDKYHMDWPLEMLSVVTFAEHAGISKGTVVTVTWSSLTATDAERATFNAGHDSMRGGWTGTLDQLDEHLKAM